MKHIILAVISLFGSIFMTLEVSAQRGECSCNQGCYAGVGEACRAGFYANATWPRSYIPASRRAVCQTYAAMIQNGWRRQNLLGNYHFDENSNELTEAGKLKVNWILSQAPVDRRSIFVQRGINEAQTATRIASVHDRAANMSPTIGHVEVNDTHLVAEGHSAGVVDSMFVGFQANRPLPALPASTGSESGE